MDLFEVKVSYNPNGYDGTKKELYLVDAVSFTEAEAKAIAFVAPYSSSDVTIVAERKSGVSEVLGRGECGDGSAYYRGKLSILVDAEKEKWSDVSYYINAAGFRDALGKLEEEGNKMLCDCYVVELKETAIANLIV